MSDARPYEVIHLADLERIPANGPTLRPLRRVLGIQAFGTNCWTADEVGGHVIEGHRESGGPEELYVVLEGRATFTLGEEAIDAPAGTVVAAPPGTFREAVAVEAGTTVMAIGGPAGESYRPLPWEETYLVFGYQRLGRADEGRAALHKLLAERPDEWQGPYNAACFEALEGNRDAALDHLRRAVELNAVEARKLAPGDADLDSLRADPRYRELVP